jgi:hypothetical protein
VVLNGASSAGKTTLATAFRDQRANLGDFWLLTGIDDYLAKLPYSWKSAGADRGAFAADGIRFDKTPAGVAVRVGRGRSQLLRASQAGVGAAGASASTSLWTRSSPTRRAGRTGARRSEALTRRGSAFDVPPRSPRSGTESVATDSAAWHALKR